MAASTAKYSSSSNAPSTPSSNKARLLKTTPSAVANSVWSIEDIVGGPRYEMVSGKKRKMYKVRWSESYEQANNIPQELIEIYEKRGQKAIRVLGPVIDTTKEELAAMDNDDDGESAERASAEKEPKKRRKNIQNMRFAVETGDDVVVMSYKQVRSLYKDELFEYFEERAKLEGF